MLTDEQLRPLVHRDVEFTMAYPAGTQFVRGRLESIDPLRLGPIGRNTASETAHPLMREHAVAVRLIEEATS